MAVHHAACRFNKEQFAAASGERLAALKALVTREAFENSANEWNADPSEPGEVPPSLDLDGPQPIQLPKDLGEKES